MHRFILVAFLFFFVASSIAQGDVFVDKSFLIIQSGKNYQRALKKAQLACNKLGIPLDLRGCHADKEYGLASVETCDCGENHGYIPRGRGDDGNYISIEYSSAFKSFSSGYYIVVVSSGEKANVQAELANVQKHYKAAYVKTSPVYVGCMH